MKTLAKLWQKLKDFFTKHRRTIVIVVVIITVVIVCIFIWRGVLPMSKFRKNLSPCDSNGNINEVKLRQWMRMGDAQAYALEPKYDGSRYLFHLHRRGHHLTSRRKSVKTEEFVDRIKQVRHFRKLRIPRQLEGTIIDGEMVSPSMKLAGTHGVAGVLNSKPRRAYKRQQQYGKLKMMTFNLLRYKNKSVADQPLSNRRKLLEEALGLIYKKNPKAKKFLLLTPQTKPHNWKDIVATYRQALENGFEGIMIKDGREPDGKGMWKMKVWRDTCGIVTGVKPGTGQFKNLIGSLKFSVYQDGKLVEVGKCSGMDVAERKRLSRIWKHDKLFGQIVEVRAQEMGSAGRLRHARFQRMRDDYPPEKCTIQKLKKDLELI